MGLTIRADEATDGRLVPNFIPSVQEWECGAKKVKTYINRPI